MNYCTKHNRATADGVECLACHGERIDRLTNPPLVPKAPVHVDRASALDVPVAGSHYKDKKIQPVEYIHANGLGFLEGCIVKRITRWRDKDGIKDLEKIKHEVDLLIELEGKNK